MDDALKKDFQNRIAVSGRKELLLIHYEMILAELKLAEKEIAEDGEGLRRSVALAMEMVKKLVESLDFSYELSYVLLRAYRQLNRELIATKVQKDKAALQRGKHMIEQLKEAFSGIEVSSDAPMVQNSETLYAGLTYGKDNRLKESVDYQKRGFQA